MPSKTQDKWLKIIFNILWKNNKKIRKQIIKNRTGYPVKQTFAYAINKIARQIIYRAMGFSEITIKNIYLKNYTDSKTG